jgi:signal transduction histidine kinase
MSTSSGVEKGTAGDAALAEQRAEIERLVAELRERTAALEEANRELLRVSRYRSLFLARMSHELRTPLTSVLGFAEVLLEHCGLTDTQREFCEKILASGQQLRVTVNQLVDLSRLEAGQAELFLHEFSVRETLRESCEAVERQARKRRVALDCETAPECGAVVSDEGKLRQVFYSLLAYAIERSPEGGTVRVRALPCEGGRLGIEIADEGEAVEDAARLFESLDVARPNERGAGVNELGLAIAYRLVEALGGALAARGGAGGGLTFRAELPARPAEE